MVMRAKTVYEFNKTGDVKSSLGMGMKEMIFKITYDREHYLMDYYSESDWRKIIDWLFAKGYEPYLVSEILMSSLPRWIAEVMDETDSEENPYDFFVKSIESRDSEFYNGIEDFLKKWVYPDSETIKLEFEEEVERRLNENASAPMSTLNNTPGMGNAVPPSPSNGGVGSGDLWGAHPKRKKVYRKRKKSKSISEDSINPYDKIGAAMAKKMKVPLYFKKGKGRKDVEQKTFAK